MWRKKTFFCNSWHSIFTFIFYKHVFQRFSERGNDWTEYDENVSFSMLDTVQGERLKMHFTESFGLFRRHKKPSWIFKDWVTDWVPWSVFMGSLCWIVSDSWSEFVHSCLCPAAAAWAFTESRINPLGLSGRTWVSQFNVLRLGHLGERLLHPQGGQTRGRIVSPTLGHQFTHLPQTLDKHTQRQD